MDGGEIDDRLADGGFSRPGFSDQPQRFALADGEGNVLDGMDRALQAPQHAAMNREADGEIARLQHRLAVRQDRQFADRLGRHRVDLQLAGEARHGRDEAARVRVLRVAENLVHAALLEHAAVAHDKDVVRHFRDHAHVVGDEQHRRAGLALQRLQQVQRLGLHGHIERRRRLVGDDHGGIAGQRHRDHDALAHAAGKRMRVLPDALFRVGDAHLAQHFQHGLAQVRALQSAVDAHHLRKLVADGLHRVQRGHRFLEDHADAAAPHPAHLGLGQLQQVASVQPDGSLYARDPFLQEPHDRQRSDAFAGAGFADQRQRLARPDLEAHALDHGFLPKGDTQVADLDNRLIGVGLAAHQLASFSRGSIASRRPSPIRLSARTSSRIARLG